MQTPRQHGTRGASADKCTTLHIVHDYCLHRKRHRQPVHVREPFSDMAQSHNLLPRGGLRKVYLATLRGRVKVAALEGGARLALTTT